MTEASALIASAVASLVLIGYAVGATNLTKGLPNHGASSPGAALGLLLLAVALLVDRRRSRSRRAATQVLATAALLTVAWMPLAGRLGADVALADVAFMSPLDAVLIGLLAVGVLLLDAPSWRGRRVHHVLALAAMPPPILVLVAHASGAETLPPPVRVGIPAAIAVVAVATALLSRDPSSGMAAVVYGPGVAGVLARRILPVAVVIAVAATWLSETAQDLQYLSSPLGEALLVAGAVTLFALVVLASITRLHRAEAEQARLVEKVRLNEAFLRQVTERAGAILAVKDAEGRFLFVNEAAVDFLDMPEDAILGRTSRDVWPTDVADEVERQDRQVLAEGRPLTREQEFTSGERRTLLMTRAPFLDVDGRPAGIILVGLDITDRKRMEAELKRSNEELSRFAAVAAHDLREPLRKIRIFGSLVLDRVHDDPGEASRAAARMITAAERLDRLVEDLLRYTRLEATPPELVPVDLRSVVKDVLEDLAPKVSSERATVHVSELPRVEASRGEMHQLIQNLLDNALKYRRPDMPPEVWVDADVEADEVHLHVRDNGVGFDSDLVDRMFEPFRRLHVSHGHPGTGMGLAIARRIAERHGGRITAEGRRGEGSTFTVSLPRAPPPVRGAAPPAQDILGRGR